MRLGRSLIKKISGGTSELLPPNLEMTCAFLNAFG
jgi:hypothetical protein